MLTAPWTTPVPLRTLLSVARFLGLMGWLCLQLDMATALLASVARRLAVDDTFHWISANMAGLLATELP
jgi:hypothetical protein